MGDPNEDARRRRFDEAIASGDIAALQEALGALREGDMRHVFARVFETEDPLARFLTTEWIGQQAPPPEGSARRTTWLRALNNGCLWGAELTGQVERRKAHADRALAHAAENPPIFHNAATLYCALELAAEALAVVRSAKENEFARLHAMADDPDLDLIRGLPEFRALVAEATRAAARAHKARMEALSNSHFAGDPVPKELSALLERSVGQAMPKGAALTEAGTQPASSGDTAFDDALLEHVDWCLRLPPLAAGPELLGFLRSSAGVSGVVVALASGKGFWGAGSLWGALRLRTERARRAGNALRMLEVDAANYEVSLPERDEALERAALADDVLAGWGSPSSVPDGGADVADARTLLRCVVQPLPYPSDSVARVGGVPIGIAADTWPRAEAGHALTHLLTIDLDAHADLRERLSQPPEIRALALFVDDPAWHHRVGELEHRWVPISSADIEEHPRVEAQTGLLPRRRLAWGVHEVPARCLNVSPDWTRSELKLAEEVSEFEGFIAEGLRFHPSSLGVGFRHSAWLCCDEVVRIELRQSGPAEALLARTGFEYEPHVACSDSVRGTFSAFEQLLTRFCLLAGERVAMSFAWRESIEFEVDGKRVEVPSADPSTRVGTWVDACLAQINDVLAAQASAWRFVETKGRIQLLSREWLDALEDALEDALDDALLPVGTAGPDQPLPTIAPLTALLDAPYIFDEGISYVSLVASQMQRMADQFGAPLRATPRFMAPSEGGRMHLSMSSDYVSWTTRLEGASHTSRRKLLRELNRNCKTDRRFCEVRLEVYDTAVVFASEDEAAELARHGYLAEDWRCDWADAQLGEAGVEVARFSDATSLPALVRQMVELMGGVLELSAIEGGYRVERGAFHAEVAVARGTRLREVTPRFCRAVNGLLHQGREDHRWIVYQGEYDQRLVYVSCAWASTLREFLASVADSLESEFAPEATLLPIRYPRRLPTLAPTALARIEDLVPRKRLLHTDFKCSARESDYPDLFAELASFAGVDVVVEPRAIPDASRHGYTVLVSYQGVTSKVRIENRKYADASPMLDYLNERLAENGSEYRLLVFSTASDGGVVLVNEEEARTLHRFRYTGSYPR